MPAPASEVVDEVIGVLAVPDAAVDAFDVFHVLFAQFEVEQRDLLPDAGPR